MPPVEVFQFRATEYRSGAATLNTGDAIYAFKTVEQPEVSRKPRVTTRGSEAGGVPSWNACSRKKRERPGSDGAHFFRDG